MKIKAAVFDIDGTLVPYGAPGPGQAAVQALRELAQSGVAVVIATGRARYTAQWVLGSGIKPDYFAAVNGADVTDAAGRPVWQSRMTPEEMYALVDFCEDHELPLEFIFSDAYYVYVEYAAFVEKYCGQNAASGFFDSVLRDGEDQVRHLQDMAPARQWTRAMQRPLKRNTAIWACGSFPLHRAGTTCCARAQARRRALAGCWSGWVSLGRKRRPSATV